ncbi:dihydropteroate synthase [Desulforudis sp. 1088]|uniref:dihydropteroate synthase n=2 Tax=Candidatus Desulforudis TaxID=471826 RepID=UPI003BE6CCAA
MRWQVRPVSVTNTEEARREIALVGADDWGCKIMAPKAVYRLLKVTGLAPWQANILKQEMLARGGEAAVSRGCINCSVESTDVLLMGTVTHYRSLARKLLIQPFGLPELGARLRCVVDNLEQESLPDLDCRGIVLPLSKRTLVMGILNVTPDSFSDGGLFMTPESALARARRMVEEGADIIDLGGESTRPGHTPVPAEVETARILPVLRLLVRELPVPVSVDTSKAAVARAALEAGAHVINDQWALRDPGMAELVAGAGVSVVLMHNREKAVYRDLMGEVWSYFEERVELALKSGISERQLILDPGFGFGKTPAHNLEILRRLGELKGFGLPILIGTSRKSTIGKVLDLPVDQRLEGTAATVAVGIAGGAGIVRVHDVLAMTRVARMTDAILRGWDENG